MALTLLLSVDFAPAARLDGEFAFGVRQIEVRDRFGDGEEAMHVVRAGEEFE